MLPGNKLPSLLTGASSRASPDAVGSTELVAVVARGVQPEEPLPAPGAPRRGSGSSASRPTRFGSGHGRVEAVASRLLRALTSSERRRACWSASPSFVGTEEWWDWWLRLPAASATRTQPNTAQLVQQVADARRDQPLSPSNSAAVAPLARGLLRGPPPAAFLRGCIEGLLRPAVFGAFLALIGGGVAFGWWLSSPTTTAST